jgi:hypothetical protein
MIYNVKQLDALANVFGNGRDTTDCKFRLQLPEPPLAVEARQTQSGRDTMAAACSDSHLNSTDTGPVSPTPPAAASLSRW